MITLIKHGFVVSDSNNIIPQFSSSVESGTGKDLEIDGKKMKSESHGSTFHTVKQKKHLKTGTGRQLHTVKKLKTVHIFLTGSLILGSHHKYIH